MSPISTVPWRLRMDESSKCILDYPSHRIKANLYLESYMYDIPYSCDIDGYFNNMGKDTTVYICTPESVFELIQETTRIRNENEKLRKIISETSKAIRSTNVALMNIEDKLPS